MKKECKTLKNKICSLVLILIGVVSVLLDGDATAFVLFTLLGVGLFFEKDNVIC